MSSEVEEETVEVMRERLERTERALRAERRDREREEQVRHERTLRLDRLHLCPVTEVPPLAGRGQEEVGGQGGREEQE